MCVCVSLCVHALCVGLVCVHVCVSAHHVCVRVRGHVCAHGACVYVCARPRVSVCVLSILGDWGQRGAG